MMSETLVVVPETDHIMNSMWERLSVRELEVLELAAQGRKDLAIAADLGIKVSTVRGYWSRIRAKIGVSSRPELVARHVRHATLRQLGQNFESVELDWLTARLEADRALEAERVATDELLAALHPSRRSALSVLRAKVDAARDLVREREDSRRRSRRTE